MRPVSPGSGQRRQRPSGDTDGGWLSLEFTGMAFLLLVCTMTVLHGLAAMFAVTQANGAARAAAREYSISRSASAASSAAQSAVSGSLRPVQVSGSGERWTTTVTAPRIAPWLPTIRVSRSATMPYTG